MRCEYCANYMTELDRCKFCNFEYEERIISDDWDIFKLDEDDGWEHKQILYRLHSKGIDCILADIYYDKNVGFLIGCFADSKEIASVLNLYPESVYAGLDNGLVFLNLYMEKAYRLGIDICKEWED